MTVLVALFLVVALSAYVLFGGADFGAGIVEPTLPTASMRSRLQATMAPVWEANHVWLIAVVVILFVGFPRFYSQAMTRLYVPISLALLAILVRGTFFTLRKYDPDAASSARLYSALFRASSFAAPLCFGFVVAGLLSEHPGSPTAIPAELTFGAIYVTPWGNGFGLSCGIFVASLFGYVACAFFLGELDSEQDRRRLRARLLVFFAATVVSGGVVLLLGAVTGRVSLSRGIHPGQILAQAIALCASLGLLWALKRRQKWGVRFSAGAQVLAILSGWFLTQYPHLLRFSTGSLTLDDAAAPPVTQFWLLLGLTAVLLAVIPLLVLLYRVFDGATHGSDV